MINRRLILLAGLSFGGCSSFDYEIAEGAYTEEFEFLYVSRSGRELAVVGEKYHYVFENAPQPLVGALNSGLRKSLAASFGGFELKTSSRLEGRWKLSYAGGDAQLEKVAVSLGFNRGDAGEYYLDGVIQGERYEVEEKEIFRTEKTNKKYKVKIKRGRDYVGQEWLPPEERMRSTPLKADRGLWLSELHWLGEPLFFFRLWLWC